MVLKKKINELKKFIDEEENSFPLNIKELIDNDEYIKEKKQDITDDIHEYEIMITQVEKSICQVLKE
ncbi:MAG TPA: hypothetical protein DIT16_08360 [Clostridium sp.]|nr:hypothetical protein [Clostridium sp.]